MCYKSSRKKAFCWTIAFVGLLLPTLFLAKDSFGGLTWNEKKQKVCGGWAFMKGKKKSKVWKEKKQLQSFTFYGKEWKGDINKRK